MSQHIFIMWYYHNRNFNFLCCNEEATGASADKDQHNPGIWSQSHVWGGGLTADGGMVHPTQPVCPLGPDLTGIVIRPRVAATEGAFAIFCPGSGVIAWGKHDEGGDSSAVQAQLKNVQSIAAGWCAFAAILADGSVVTWGKPENGGDSSAVQDQLKNVKEIHGNAEGFAAILADGSVVSWGGIFNFDEHPVPDWEHTHLNSRSHQTLNLNCKAPPTQIENVGGCCVPSRLGDPRWGRYMVQACNPTPPPCDGWWFLGLGVL